MTVSEYGNIPDGTLLYAYAGNGNALKFGIFSFLKKTKESLILGDTKFTITTIDINPRITFNFRVEQYIYIDDLYLDEKSVIEKIEGEYFRHVKGKKPTPVSDRGYDRDFTYCNSIRERIYAEGVRKRLTEQEVSG